MMKNLLLTALAFELAGCGKTTEQVIFEGKCGANTLRVLHVTKETFETRYERVAFQVNDSELLVTDNQTAARQLPYDYALYALHPLRILDSTNLYRTPEERQGRFNTILHFDPGTYSRVEFDGFANCLAAHGPAVQAAIAREPHLSVRFKVGAVAYGREEDFTGYFRQSELDYYRIYPDGAISYVKTEAGMEVTSSGGLGDFVQPGYVIEITDAAFAAKQNFAAYVNNKGETMSGKFRLVPKR